MYEARAKPILLNVWKDPQGDVILVYSEHECSVYFGCWLDGGKPADYICQLSFFLLVVGSAMPGALAVRSFPGEFLPYEIVEGRSHSDIYEIEDSPWLAERAAYSRRMSEEVYKTPPLPFATRHLVAKGHDIYHEILADGFREEKVERRAITDKRLLALLWDG